MGEMAVHTEMELVKGWEQLSCKGWVARERAKQWHLTYVLKNELLSDRQDQENILGRGDNMTKDKMYVLRLRL